MPDYPADNKNAEATGKPALVTQALTSAVSSRDNRLWRQCWRDRSTDFHQKSVNAFLTRFWPGFELEPGSRVFVPLCGKSLDMIWLAAQGHEVIGVELSPIAVRAFFNENHLQPVRRRAGKFTLWEHGTLRILCGDYFSLTPSDLGRIDAVYDRASLTALPEDIRKLYVAHLTRLIPEARKLFLLTTEDAEEGETEAQAFGIDEEIKMLYSENFEIELACVDSLFEPGAELPGLPRQRTSYKVYRLRTR
ncbi:thiopurine S-methyltransferase [Candidatus Methylospira mobilis]|uniref:Thiopurine S-methyltransferase n=1 Tax=Candidatus Methylospira mobilis TaxID=1808979 RepID=A0A5Q0BQC5_9GAMM|nr:thiopurine S-methyltransferase [Candidatus Methylospira mobilis]QFY44404.1 thiopurine S-methyltransferase [Candidatus Methylospira mobilis]WNV06159.1 thiopurine S-methyltransferase [Candidatus Methylospira mobilis]